MLLGSAVSRLGLNTMNKQYSHVGRMVGSFNSQQDGWKESFYDGEPETSQLVTLLMQIAIHSATTDGPL